MIISYAIVAGIIIYIHLHCLVFTASKWKVNDVGM